MVQLGKAIAELKAAMYDVYYKPLEPLVIKLNEFLKRFIS